MKEIVLKIFGSGEVGVEEIKNGIKTYKRIAPDDLIKCIGNSLMRGGISSGLLPDGCLSYEERDDSSKKVSVLYRENRADISYFGTDYPNFPLPRLVFGFDVSSEGRVYDCRVGVMANETVIKPSIKMYRYPFSNVSGFKLCTGNNSLPKCKSLHTIGSLPYFILSMANNNDHFSHDNNKRGLEMRDLLELLKDKEPEYYYSDILIPFQNGATLNDFIK